MNVRFENRKKNKKTVIKGNPIDLMAQWTFIGNAIYKAMKAQIGEETAEKLMRRYAENVFKSEKQIAEEILEILKRKQEKESEESDNE